jgi:hypothetical protein
MRHALSLDGKNGIITITRARALTQIKKSLSPTGINVGDEMIGNKVSVYGKPSGLVGI